jgi:heavy metal sensor kinase
MPSRVVFYLRSIRVTLVLYFLVLLGAALGGVAYFCFSSTQEALAGKEKSTRALWEKEFKEFNAIVLAQATKLGNRINWTKHRIEAVNLLAILSTAPLNDFQTVALPWLQATQPSLVREENKMRGLDLRIQHHEDDNFLPVVEKGQYFQTYLLGKAGIVPLEASDTLSGFVWQLDPKLKAKLDDNVPRFDKTTVAGKEVLRVSVRIPVSSDKRGINFILPQFSYFDIRGFPTWPVSPGVHPLPKYFPNRPVVYMQYGALTEPRDATIKELTDKFEANLADLVHDLDEARGQLRARLFWVALGVFAAGLVGGLWLVHLSLLPLNRLSEAVSRVSEKDFRLQLDSKPLPRELAPIAARVSATLEQLKRAFDREKQAAADISHELRTPVAALLTACEISLRKPRSASEYREVLEDCRINGQQIHQLVERLLTLARLDAGADLLRPREVSVSAVADQCVAMVRPLAEVRGIKVNVHHNGPSSLHADPDKLREVLTNLLHNAIEYNKPDGSIDVKVERNNGTLSVEVSDTGIGMSQETRQHIFERFFRADPSRHSDSPHAGLGLAIVKGYVELMGGAVDVESAPGVGSTFRVRLPAKE